MQQSFSLDTDHFQFYLEDLAIDHDTSMLWDAIAMQRRLDVLDGLVAIATVRWGTDTTITITIGDQAPGQEDVSQWDHIVEANIRAISGQLSLTTPEGDAQDAPNIAIAPGNYRVRVYFGNLDLIDDELATEGPDTYHLYLWPEVIQPPVVLKQAFE